MFFKLDYTFPGDLTKEIMGLVGRDAKIYWIARDIGRALNLANGYNFAYRKANRIVYHAIGDTFSLGKRILKWKVFEQDELLIILNQLAYSRAQAFANVISSTETRVLPINDKNQNIYPNEDPSVHPDYAPILEISPSLEEDSRSLLRWLKDFKMAVMKKVYGINIPPEPDHLCPVRKRRDGLTYSTPTSSSAQVTSTTNEEDFIAEICVRDRSPSSLPNFTFEMDGYPPERLRMICGDEVRVFERRDS